MAAKKFTLRGKKELIKKLKQFRGNVEDGAKKVVKSTSAKMVKEIKGKLADGNGDPSAEGSAPHSQKTRETKKLNSSVGKYDLKASVKWKLFKPRFGKEIIARVRVKFPGSNSFYGHMLEYGTTNMAARPFFWGTIRRNESAAKKSLERVIKKAAKKWKK